MTPDNSYTIPITPRQEAAAVALTKRGEQAGVSQTKQVTIIEFHLQLIRLHNYFLSS